MKLGQDLLKILILTEKELAAQENYNALVNIQQISRNIHNK